MNDVWSVEHAVLLLMRAWTDGQGLLALLRA